MSTNSTIINEVRAALSGGDSLSTADLVPLCDTADDAKNLSRIIYDMRRAGLVEEDPVPGPRGGDMKPSRRWRWVGPTDGAALPSKRHPRAPAKARESIEDEAPSGAPAAPVTHKPEPLRHIPMEEIAETMTPKRNPIVHNRTDPTEAALSDLVDQADEAVLSLADSLLSDHPVWHRLRTLADDAHSALCDYRLLRSLEDSK
jgi:hypothetical protein